MADDRVDGNELPLTHEFLALMLAVRRMRETRRAILNLSTEAQSFVRVAPAFQEQ